MLAAEPPEVESKHNMADIEKDEEVVDLVAGDAAGKKKKKKKKKKGGKADELAGATLTATGSDEGEGSSVGETKQNDDEASRKAEEEAKRKAEEEAQRQREEEMKRKDEEEKRAEEERKKKEEEERKRKEEEERKQKEEVERKRKEEEAQKEAEAARLKAEEESKRAAEEAEKRLEAAGSAKTEEEEEDDEEEEEESGEEEETEEETEEEEEAEPVAEVAPAASSPTESQEDTVKDKGKEPAPVLETTTVVQQEVPQAEAGEGAETDAVNHEADQALTLQRRDTYERAKLEQRVAEQDISLFTRFDRHKHVVLRKTADESLGFMITETSRQALLPCIFISHIFPGGAASRSGELMVGDTILSVNGTSVVGLPFPKILDLFKVASQTVKIELIVVPVEPVVVVTISRSSSPTGKLGFDVLHGEIVSVDRDGPAHVAGLRAGHRITEINGVSVVDCAHEKIVEFLQAQEVKMKTMPKDLYHTLVATFPPPSP